MTLDELLEKQEDKWRLLTLFVSLSVSVKRHYKEGVTGYVDGLMERAASGSDEELAEDIRRAFRQSEDETFLREISHFEEPFKALFWILERWHFGNREGGRLLTPKKNIARSWQYFLNIVVPAQPGVWKEYTKDGRVTHVLDTRAGFLSHQYMRELEQDERDKVRDDHRRQSLYEADERERFKARGFPYAATYPEYLRFLKNNFEAMHVGGFQITLDDILSLFLPYPVDIDQFKRGHTYIVGRSGSGKSELLKGICTRLKYDYVLLDPHGDLADEIGMMDISRPWRIAPHEKRFVINPFDIEDKSEDNRELVAQEITALIAELVDDSGLSRLMTTIIFPVVYTLLKLPYADFKMLTDCINPNAGKAHLKSIRHLVEPHHAAIWRELESDTYDTSKQSVFNRLQSLLNYRLVMQTLCGRDDFAGVLEKELEKGLGAIVSLPIPTIGEAVSVTLGRFFMTRMQIWAKRRQNISKKERRPLCLIVDEFHNFMSHSTAETLDQYGRKFGLFMILAHQHIQQIADREIRGSVLANTVNKIAGMSNTETRQAISREMGIEAEVLGNLRPGNFWGRFGSEEPFNFYARMVRKPRRTRQVYHESKNGAEIIDGWEGFDQEEDPRNQETGTTKTPKKGFTPKCDI